MTTPAIDLDLYCQRIGYRGERVSTLDSLRQLQQLHTQTIPFENLSSLDGERVSIALSDIQNKLLLQERGGYCFEHNTLLWNVLTQFGFAVSGLAARVRWNVPDELVTPIGHMVLKVVIDQTPYLVDAGFGGLTVTAPLRLDDGQSQATTHEAFRIVRSGETHTLYAQLNDVWKPLYAFELQPYVQPDYEVWNWFTCTAPQSPFVTRLMCARPTPQGRHALIDNRYTYRPQQGEVTTRMLSNAEQLLEVLNRDFGIRVPNSPTLQAKLSELAGKVAG